MIYAEPPPDIVDPAGAARRRHAATVGLCPAHHRTAAGAALRLRAAGCRCSTPATRADGTVASVRSLPLVERDDEAVAILGPGEDVLLEFDGARRPAARRLDAPRRARHQGVVQGHGPLHQGRRDGGAAAWDRHRRTTGAARRVQHSLRGWPMSDSARTTPITPALRWLLARPLSADRRPHGHRRLSRRRLAGRIRHRRELSGLRLPVDGARAPRRRTGRRAALRAVRPRHTRWRRGRIPNRRAARMGYVLAALAVVVLVTGLGLLRVAGIDLRQPGARAIVYWAHVLAPVGVAWAFVNHRRRGRALAPRAAWTWAAATAALVALTAAVDVRTSRSPAVTEAAVELRAVVRAHGQRPGHSRRRADGRRLLRRVPHRCAPWLAVERAPLQLVQQRGLHGERQGDARGDAGPRRQRRRQPLVRRLPRSGAALQRRVRPRRLRHRERPDVAGRPHLHRLPRHRAGEQHPGQRRLHDRRAAPLPVRVQRHRRRCARSASS